MIIESVFSVLFTGYRDLQAAGGSWAVTEVFGTLIVLSFGWFLYRQKKYSETDMTSVASTVMTSLGITGTFVGILFGLQDFQINDIDNSIATLLDGLKIAFATSVLGLFSSLMAQAVLPYVRRKSLDKNDSRVSEELSASDFLKVLQEQSQILERQEAIMSGQAESMERMVATAGMTFDKIGGPDQTSVINQLGQSRSDFRQFDEQLQRKLDEVAETLSESATKQIIEALNEVIRDFNQKLTEQFGENFKKLNEAVLELVTWQENYKQQLAEMKISFDQSVSSLGQTAESVTSISEHTATIPSAMSDLSPIVTTVQEQIRDLGQHLESFRALRDKAVEAVPETQRHLESVVADITDSAKQANDLSMQFTKSSQDMLDRFAQTNTEFLSGFKDLVATGSSEIKSTFENVSGKMREDLESASSTIQQMSESVESHAVQLKDDHKSAIEETNAKTREVLDTVDQHHALLQKTFQDSVSTIQSGYQDVLSNTRQAAANMAEQISSVHEQSAKRLEGSIDQVASELEKKTQGFFGLVEENSKASAAESRQILQDSMENLTRTIDQEIERVVQAMGTGLTTLSNAMVRDLTEMEKITGKMASQFDRGVQ